MALPRLAVERKSALEFYVWDQNGSDRRYFVTMSPDLKNVVKIVNAKGKVLNPKGNTAYDARWQIKHVLLMEDFKRARAELDRDRKAREEAKRKAAN